MPGLCDIMSCLERLQNELMTEKRVHNRIFCTYVYSTMHYADIAHMMDVPYILRHMLNRLCGAHSGLPQLVSYGMVGIHGHNGNYYNGHLRTLSLFPFELMQ